MTMSMPNVWNCMAGSVIYAVWRPRTKWGLKCSILVMVLCIRMELTVPSGYAAKNARKPITWNVSLKIKKEKLSSPFFALLMNVEDLGGRGPVKRVIKWVTVLTLSSVGSRQKTSAKKIRPGKDGRRIAPRKDASAGRDTKEQKWTWCLTFGKGTKHSPQNRGCPRTRYTRGLESPTQLYVSVWVVEEVVENMGR